MLSEISERSNGVTLHFTTLHPASGCDSVTTNVTLLCNRDQTSEISLVGSSDNCRLEESSHQITKIQRNSMSTSILSTILDSPR